MSAALRARVAKSISQVVVSGQSLSEILPNYDHLEVKDRALARELTFGTLRQYFKLMVISEQLLKKPLKQKDCDVLSLILVGLYQLFYTRIPDHAVLSETVQAAIKIKKPWAKGLINALLRTALRESVQLLAGADKDPATAHSLPQWIYKHLKADWPDDYEQISQNSHRRALLTLRVNSRHLTRDDYLKRLEDSGVSASIHPLAKNALLLDKSCDVRTLPGYVAGDFSVQDSAAQLAAQLLDVKPGQHILDACAAPGGKTAHILELVDNKATVIALDNSAARLERLQENLLRLKLSAKTIVADASHSNSWHKGEAFDRILCDAPCSALGVIRRHPDIAILRREDDIQKLIGLQEQILDDLWPLLKVDGILLYATCSILKVENALQVDNFLKRHHDAKLLEIKSKGSDSLSLKSNTLGWQIYPGEQQMDGFYYAKLYKHEKSTKN